MSTDDHLIGIKQQLDRANHAMNDRRWSTVLDSMDKIVEHANEVFDAVGKMDAQKAEAGR